MNRIRLWPHAVLIIVAFAVVGAIAALLWQKYERRAEASSLPNAARIERVDGLVGINQTGANSTNSQWVSATPNMPVTVGDRIYTKQNSQTQLGFSGRNLATINANTSLDILDLSETRTQVALREGSALFDVGSVTSGNLFEVATPCGAVDLQQPGLYQVAINDNGNAVATVFSGQAQIVGQGGSGQIQKGEYMTVSCQGNAQAVVSRIEPNQAGYQIDSYYRSRYPKRYDGRYRNYYTYLDDPYYYDPARYDSSYNYVSDYVPGIYDLDDYGDWQYVNDYGYCWHPRVNAGWAPYESGYWTMDYPYGLTWVSTEPWGYAPYHYGRWAYASNEWFWVPDSINAYPTYSPALVAFIPLGQSSLAWVALGPSDPYEVTYYDPSWQPLYTYPSTVVVERLVNISAPGAVTVVPTSDFTRVIDPTIVTRVDPQTIASVRPVLDPLTVDPLRTVAFQTREARQRIDVPRQVEQRIVNTPVMATTAPTAPAFNRDLARTLRVQPVTAQARKQQLPVSDQRAAAPTQTTQQPNIAGEQARERQMADLARQAARGDRNARQQMQELRKQQLGQGATAGATVQAQGQPVGQPARPQDQRQLQRQQQQADREAARQQMIQSQQQQRAAAQQQAQSQREQRRNQMQQEQAVRHAQQQQVLRSQPARQPRPEAQPRQQSVRPPQIMRPQPQPQAQPRPQPVRPAQAQPRQQMMRPPEMRPQPQAQPRPQPVRPAQAQPQAQPRPQPVRPAQAQPQPQQKQQAPPGQSKAPAKKHP